MNKKKKVDQNTIKTAKRLLKYITETYKLRLILVFICIFLSAVASISVSLSLKYLLENAIQASAKTEPARRKINVEVYPHHNHLLLIHVENTFDGKIQQKNNIFQSSKRSGNGIGIESVRHITDKNGGACDFTYKDGIFSAKIMLRI